MSAAEQQRGRDAACAIMRSLCRLRVRETGGQNRGPEINAIHEWMGRDDDHADAYCAQAVGFAWRLGGLATGQQLDPRIPRTGSSWHLLHDTRARAPDLVLLAHEITDPYAQVQPGDAMIRYEVIDPSDPPSRSNSKLGHVELVQAVYPDGWLDTDGGNTDSNDGREGSGFFSHYKRYRIGPHGDPRVQGIVRPRWIALPPAAPRT